MVAISGYLPGQTNTFMFGIAHGHEYNGSLTSLVMDGTSYALDNSFTLGQVKSGSTISATATSIGYGNTQVTDDFGTMTKNMSWTGSSHTQSWSLALTKTYVTSTVYTSMWPASYNSEHPIFRYGSIGNDFNLLLPNGDAGSNTYATPYNSSNSLSYFGGDSNLSVSITTEDDIDQSFIWITNEYGKGYLQNLSRSKTWTNGETIAPGATTFTLTYQEPSSVTWTGGKTLVVPRSPTIDTVTESLPFDGNNIIVKPYSNVSLTFNNVVPTRTTFTSVNDNSIGERDYSSTGSPVAGDWLGIIASGSDSTYANVIKYATTGITASNNSNIYNNSFYQNSTGINASSGSLIKNNAIINSTTATVGAGTFDYNCYLGNTEPSGMNDDPIFVSDSDFHLQSTSLAIDSGADVSLTTDYEGNPIYGLPDIGAYEYQPPYIMGTDDIDIGAGTRIYGDGQFRDVGITSSLGANLSITPENDFETYTSGEVRPQWLDISNITWTANAKEWTESSDDPALANTVHTTGDSTSGAYYYVKVDGELGTEITGDNCINSICLADGNGNIIFTYTGTYSSHTFEITPREGQIITDINETQLKINRNEKEALDEDEKFYLDEDKAKLKGQDATLANGQVKIYKDGRKYATVDVDSNGSWSKKITFGHNKNYTIKLKFYDQYGTLRDTKEYDVEVDTQKPVFADPFPETLTIQKDKPINFPTTDEDTSVDFYKIKLLDENGHILRGWREQKKSVYFIPDSVLDQAKNIVVRAYDKSGNYSEEQTLLNIVENQSNAAAANNNVQTNNFGKESSGQQVRNDTSKPNVCSYTVQSGDTLWKIAQEVYGNGSAYPKIIETNKDKYPNIDSVLSIGQELTFDCDNNSEVKGVSDIKKDDKDETPSIRNQNQESSEAKWWNPFTWF